MDFALPEIGEGAWTVDDIVRYDVPAVLDYVKAATGKDFQMPILHLSQLVGVAAGFEESELKFKRHVVPVTPVVEKLRV